MCFRVRQNCVWFSTSASISSVALLFPIQVIWIICLDQYYIPISYYGTAFSITVFECVDKWMNKYIPESLHLIWRAVNVSCRSWCLFNVRAQNWTPEFKYGLSALNRKLKQSNISCVCLTALSSVVLMKLGHIKSPSSLYIKLL